MGWIIGLPEDKLARWFYFYNHDPIGWFSTPTWWLWKSVFGCNGCKKPTRAFGGWFFTPAWWLEISALFHHGFKNPPRAQGGSFFHFSLVRKMGIFLNRSVKSFWKYIVGRQQKGDWAVSKKVTQHGQTYTKSWLKFWITQNMTGPKIWPSAKTSLVPRDPKYGRQQNVSSSTGHKIWPSAKTSAVARDPKCGRQQ